MLTIQIIVVLLLQRNEKTKLKENKGNKMTTDTKDYFGMITIVKVIYKGEIVKIFFSRKAARDFIFNK